MSLYSASDAEVFDANTKSTIELLWVIKYPIIDDQLNNMDDNFPNVFSVNLLHQIQCVNKRVDTVLSRFKVTSSSYALYHLLTFKIYVTISSSA